MPRKFFTPKEFLDEIRKECVRRNLDEKRIDARLLLYLVEKGILYPVRERSKNYELKKYSQIDFKVMQLLLRDIARYNNGKRNIIKSVTNVSERINKYHLIDRISSSGKDTAASVEMELNRVQLKEAYKRIVTRVSELGYEGRDKTNLLGVRRGDHAIIWIPNKDDSVIHYLFHEVIIRIVRSLENEICIFITTGNKNGILSSLQKREVDIDKIRYIFALDYREVEAQFRHYFEKIKERPEKIIEEFLSKTISKYVRREALTKGIQLEKIRHCWIINEANSNFYGFWYSRSDYIDNENKLQKAAKKALGKPNTSLCIYERDLLFESIKRNGGNLLEEVAELVGVHNRMYLLDETAHIRTGPETTRQLMLWIVANSNKKEEVHKKTGRQE